MTTCGLRELDIPCRATEPSRIRDVLVTIVQDDAHAGSCNLAAVGSMRSNNRSSVKWIRVGLPQYGLERMEAFFTTYSYDRHRHHTYAVGYAIDGAYSLIYRGERVYGRRGALTVLYQDEPHDGRLGAPFCAYSHSEESKPDGDGPRRALRRGHALRTIEDSQRLRGATRDSKTFFVHTAFVLTPHCNLENGSGYFYKFLNIPLGAKSALNRSVIFRRLVKA